MNRRLLAPLALAALLLMAGCTGSGGDATTTPHTDGTLTPVATETPDPEQTTTPAPVTPNPSIPADAYPPGASAEGITNASQLVAAHNRVMLTTDFTSQRNTTLLQANQSFRSRTVELSEIKADIDNQQALATLTSAKSIGNRTSSVSTTAFSNESFLFSKVVRGNQTTYDTRPVQSFNSTISFGSRIEGILRSGTFVPVESTQQGDHTFVRYRLTDFNRSGLPEGATVQRVRGSLVVDERGFVRGLTYQIRITNAQVALVERTFVLSVTPGDVDAERPSWIEKAIAAAR